MMLMEHLFSPRRGEHEQQHSHKGRRSSLLGAFISPLPQSPRKEQESGESPNPVEQLTNWFNHTVDGVVHPDHVHAHGTGHHGASGNTSPLFNVFRTNSPAPSTVNSTPRVPSGRQTPQAPSSERSSSGGHRSPMAKSFVPEQTSPQDLQSLKELLQKKEEELRRKESKWQDKEKRYLESLPKAGSRQTSSSPDEVEKRQNRKDEDDTPRDPYEIQKDISDLEEKLAKYHEELKQSRIFHDKCHVKERPPLTDEDKKILEKWAKANDLKAPLRCVFNASDFHNQFGGELMRACATCGNEQIARILLKYGARRESRDKFGCTAMHLAADRGNVGVLAALLDSRAKVDAVEENGVTPLYFAAENDNLAACNFLLEVGRAKPSAAGKRKQTPLHAAAEQGNVDIVETLMRNGAKVEAKDNRGRRPLHYAAANGQSLACFALLSTAKSKKKDNYGQTPEDLALFNHHNSLAESISKHT